MPNKQDSEAMRESLGLNWIPRLELLAIRGNKEPHNSDLSNEWPIIRTLTSPIYAK